MEGHKGTQWLSFEERCVYASLERCPSRYMPDLCQMKIGGEGGYNGVVRLGESIKMCALYIYRFLQLL